MKGVMIFGKKGKLNPRYIGPFRISERVGNVAYELEQPQELAAVQPVFHISMLKKCMGDPSRIIPTEDIASVKVLWRNQFVKEATWEVEEDMKKRYPHLFDPGEIPYQDDTHGQHPRTVDGLTVHPAGPWFVTENFPRTQSENSAKSRLTDRPTVRRSDHGPWFVFVDRDFPYQPLTQTTVDQHGPSFDPRSVGLTVDEVSS
ncbi:hypothetical protein MTR67_030327 [Solanum verrucosum]|uniref:Tf2-1-like SH3-like domain-containing protein n=1 Tax=Solanum verrucosum TaxID=315347 RepID=A0AAF0R5T5_SOLVR|nr:hypothetical protein MTR67_030327 [Solanum verrucosum]